MLGPVSLIKNVPGSLVYVATEAEPAVPDQPILELSEDIEAVGETMTR